MKAFTLIELLITMSIISILLGLTVVGISRPLHSTSLDGSLTQLIADIKQQQQKAMLQDNNGSGSGSSYGIYFDTTTYVLFKGATYTPSDTQNVTNPLAGGAVVSATTFPSRIVVFNQLSGEVLNHSAPASSVTLSAGDLSKTISIHRFGATTVTP